MMKADSVPPPPPSSSSTQQQHHHQRQSPISTSSSSSSNTTTTGPAAPMSPYHHQTTAQHQTNTTTTTTNSYYHPGQAVLEVKSKYDAEFRRIGLGRGNIAKFHEFYQIIERLHGLNGIQFNICYTDKDGDLLPINNDMNLARVLQVTAGILRLIIQRKGECYNTPYAGAGESVGGGGGVNFTGSNKSFGQSGGGGGSGGMGGHDTTSASYRATNLISRIKDLKDLSTTLTSSSSHHHANHYNNPKPFHISYPEDFRPVSAIIDVDIVPDTYRRVRLHKHKSSKPLGFYIRDGRSLRVTPQGVEQVPGIFISRLMPGGLAESTGLLSVNDEVIEVNGIEVAGKTLDQVTDMMVANSSNLIITVKPTNQRYNLNRSHNSTVISTTTSASLGGGGGGGPKGLKGSSTSTPTMGLPHTAASLSATPLASGSVQPPASRLYNHPATATTTSSNSSSGGVGSHKFSTSQKHEAPLAPGAKDGSALASSSSPATADSIQRHNIQQHINDDDDDEEEIHDATGANGSYEDADNSDDKILTL